MFRQSVLLVGLGTIIMIPLGACHRQSKKIDESLTAEEQALPKEPVLLEVENRNWADVVIYLLVDGKRYRFLQVGAAKDVSIQIPPSRQGTLGVFRFAIHRIGSQDEHITEQVSIRTGRTVRLTLESELRRSSIAVF